MLERLRDYFFVKQSNPKYQNDLVQYLTKNAERIITNNLVQNFFEHETPPYRRYALEDIYDPIPVGSKEFYLDYNDDIASSNRIFQKRFLLKPRELQLLPDVKKSLENKMQELSHMYKSNTKEIEELKNIEKNIKLEEMHVTLGKNYIPFREDRGTGLVLYKHRMFTFVATYLQSTGPGKKTSEHIIDVSPQTKRTAEPGFGPDLMLTNNEWVSIVPITKSEFGKLIEVCRRMDSTGRRIAYMKLSYPPILKCSITRNFSYLGGRYFRVAPIKCLEGKTLAERLGLYWHTDF